MAAKDLFHDHVKEALINDGWEITHDPYYIEYEDVEVSIDLGAEKLIAAKKSKEEIVVEIKSFTAKSTIYAFHEALGQYINYRRILEWTKDHHTLFLAISIDVYDSFFIKPFGAKIVEAEKLKILVFNPVIKNSFSKVGADQIWENLINRYNSIPLTNNVNPDLTDYVTQEALKGVYKMIAVEEKEIRTKYTSRTTDLLKQVFALQD